MKKTFFVMALLCLNFIEVSSQSFNDCSDAFPVCEMKTYHFNQMKGYGENKSDLTKALCSSNFEETNSIWLSWKSSEDGTLTFTIDPSVAKDDIDFILFQKHENCNTLEEIRCMASGITYGSNDTRSAVCNGATGLSSYSMDDFENSGCKFNDDNFLKYLSMDKGEEYILLVNNYNSSSGVSISFEGNGQLAQINGCETPSTVEHIMVTQLYPNPSSEEINIEFLSPTEEIVKLELLSITGVVLKELEANPKVGLNTATFQIEELVANTYLIRVAQLESATVKQFVKQ